jgi:hypothetical protein
MEAHYDAENSIWWADSKITKALLLKLRPDNKFSKITLTS